MVGWLGAVTNALGVGYELRVIAATVIGGTDLMGGYGTAYAAIIGAALIEIVRNALLLAGVDPYWQGTFVGLVIACAILLERVRRTRPTERIRLRKAGGNMGRKHDESSNSWLPIAALLGAAQPMAAQAKDKVFALVPKAMNNPFFDQARDGCMKAAKEIGGVECLYIGPADATEQEQVELIQDLITKHVDGIGVSAANAPAIAKVLARAKEAKIPVVTWDSDLLPADKGLRGELHRHGQRAGGHRARQAGHGAEAERRHASASRAAARPPPT